MTAFTWLCSLVFWALSLFNNVKFEGDTTLMAESEEELKSLLVKVKEENEQVGLTFRKLRSCHLVSSLHGK